jgi:hypothetical protein
MELSAQTHYSQKRTHKKTELFAAFVYCFIAFVEFGAPGFVSYGM